jgi:hypothetical protein
MSRGAVGVNEVVRDVNVRRMKNVVGVTLYIMVVYILLLGMIIK